MITVFSPEILEGITFSSGDGDHGLIAVFSPRFFGVLQGGTGTRARRREKCYGLLSICYYCLCAHSSPLGKELKQESNLSARKTKKTMRKREVGKKRKKSGDLKKGGKRERKAADRFRKKVTRRRKRKKRNGKK